MAIVDKTLIFTGTLKAGESKNKTWKNPAQHVVGVCAAPKRLDPGDIFIGLTSFQITRVQITMDLNNHFVLEYTVVNKGTHDGVCEVHYYHLA